MLLCCAIQSHLDSYVCFHMYSSTTHQKKPSLGHEHNVWSNYQIYLQLVSIKNKVSSLEDHYRRTTGSLPSASPNIVTHVVHSSIPHINTHHLDCFVPITLVFNVRLTSHQRSVLCVHLCLCASGKQSITLNDNFSDMWLMAFLTKHRIFTPSVFLSVLYKSVTVLRLTAFRI